MKCLLCGRWNLKSILCSSCLPNFSLGVRLVDELSVYSFYAFSEIEFLMHYKYLPIGSRVFSLLAKKASEYFSKNISFNNEAFGVGIDDCVEWKRGYSHTGVMLREFSRCGIKPIYGSLKAESRVSYAGKSLQFRLSNPKRFQTKLREKRIILFDDVITTGTTLKEAKLCLQSQENEILFALTLCDARQ